MKRVLPLLMIFVCLNSKTFSQCTDNSSDCVYSLEINEDTLWIGTKVGLYKYDIINKTKTLFNTENSNLPNNYVNALKLGADNSLWIGTYGGGLANFKNGIWKIFNKSNSSIASNNIFDIEIFHDSIFWLASDKGVITYNSYDWGLYNQDNSSLTYDLVYSVTNEGDSVMWVGANGGLSKFNGSWYQYTRENSGLPHNIVYTTEIIGQTKYIGTMEGLATFNSYVWDTEFFEKTLVVKHEDSNGNLWAGTSCGLKRNIIGWDTTYHTNNSILENDYIQDIIIDKYGNKWIATWGGGVYKFDNSDFLKLDILTSVIQLNSTFNVKVYPNPAINKLNIAFNEIVKIDTKIDLIDLQGVKIKSIILDKGKSEISIDIGECKTGLIFLQIHNKNDIIVRKILKQ